MKFLDNIKEIVNIFSTKDEIDLDNRSIELFWVNTSHNVTSQGFYIGAELLDNYLTFYYMIPSKNIFYTLKSYQINDKYINNDDLSMIINPSWFTYNDMSTDKYYIQIFPTFDRQFEIITDSFVIIQDGNKSKIIDISIPVCLINSIEN